MQDLGRSESLAVDRRDRMALPHQFKTERLDSDNAERHRWDSCPPKTAWTEGLSLTREAQVYS